MAGQSAERQENGVIKYINDSVKKNQKNPITLIAGKETVVGVIKAEKYKGRQLGGSEPYTDVVIYVIRNNKTETINCSLKGESAPSLAGGGLKGIELAVPGIKKRFMNAVYDELMNNKKLKIGDKVPDTFSKISSQNKLKIVVGNEKMGGPIDYMYIGPMNVSGKYDQKKNVLQLNGSLIESVHYAKTHNLFFRLRARREDQRFDPDAKEKDGTPKIYGKSPTKGDSAGRIVITDKVPTTGILINI